MLHSQRKILLRQIEHIQYGWLAATVLAVMYCAHHFYHSLTFVYNLCLSIKSDDGKFALYQHTIVHCNMVMPSQLLSGWENVLHSHQLWSACKIVGQFYPIPTLRGAYQFRGFYFGCRIISICILTSGKCKRRHTKQSWQSKHSQ